MKIEYDLAIVRTEDVSVVKRELPFTIAQPLGKTIWRLPIWQSRLETHTELLLSYGKCEVYPFDATWMELEGVIFSEISPLSIFCATPKYRAKE